MESELASMAPSIEGQLKRQRNSLILSVKPERVVEACSMVNRLDGFYHLSTITGVDEGDVITLFYHFWRGREFITVQTAVPKAEPRLASLVAVIPAAIFYEAEVADLLGVVFDGNPLTGKKLLLPDTYPQQAPPPLRKEADPEQIRKMMGLE